MSVHHGILQAVAYDRGGTFKGLGGGGGCYFTTFG